MSSQFKRRLLQGIEERLSSPHFHFVDNSPAYYNSPCAENMREDKEWFTQRPRLAPTAFIEENAVPIEVQILCKSQLYDLLADKHSKDTLVLAALYAVLGHRFVKFPYYSDATIALRQKLAQDLAVPDGNAVMSQAVREDAFGVGYPLALYAAPLADEKHALYTSPEFLYQLAAFPPYRYAFNQTVVDVEPGDCVLDCGACYGDTALLFAAKAGKNGKVLSFEPHPGIGRLFLQNRSLNPNLAERITLVPAATAQEARGEISLWLSGAGSNTGEGNARQRHVRVPVTSLDAEAARLSLPHVDFIKMDVEGAELSSLRGATDIISRFRPKLAICLYHNPKDFLTIPHFLHELDLGYRFYLEHHYMNQWETVLYALPPSA